jgi:hypothetical protein
MRKRGLAQSGRAVKKHVIECITALASSLDEYVQVFDNLLLSAELLQLPGPERFFHQYFFAGSGIVYESF